MEITGVLYAMEIYIRMAPNKSVVH